MSIERFTIRGGPELEATLRRIVVAFRLMGWAWMMLLVYLTLTTEDEPPALIHWIVWAAVALATVWTFLTWYVARRHPDTLASLGFFIADLIVLGAIASASLLSHADEFFHGGMPMSSVLVGSLWGGLLGGMIAAVLLSVEQLLVHVVAEFGVVRAAGAVVFFVVAWIVGWAFSRLRQSDIARQAAVDALAGERAAVAVHEARLELVDQLHDSVLQTFHAIRMGADDPAETRYLARRQERELRRNIEEWRSEFEHSFRATLLAARDDVEDRYRIEIEAVIRDDLPLTPGLEAAIETAREAMSNAAKHAKATHISVFSELTDEQVVVHVRDDGGGFASEANLEQVIDRLSRRVAAFDGEVTVDSDPTDGTDVQVLVSR